jgi:hypothetical protein
MNSKEVGKAIGFLLSFSIGFAACAALLHLLPFNDLRLYAEHRSEKLALLDRWVGKATVASFGSSHMHLGFDPQGFDAQFNGFNGMNCQPVKTVNLAVQGGSQTEQRAMALEYLKQASSHPERPCMILLELNAGTNFTRDHLVHPRAINIYDPSAVGFVASLSGPGLPLKQRLGRIGYGFAAGFLYFANVGMVSNVVFQPALKPEIVEDNERQDRRGFFPEPASLRDRAAVADFFRTHLGLTPKSHFLVLSSGNERLIEDLTMDRSAPKGTVRNPLFFYVLVPLLANKIDSIDAPASLETPTGPVAIINMARPLGVPALFEPDSWRDPTHLNEHGSEIFSALVGRQVRRWITSHPLPNGCGDGHAVR